MTDQDLRTTISAALEPGSFYLSNSLQLDLQHQNAESISWEVFQGRLLDATQTRERQTFEAWNVYLLDENGRSDEPLLAVKWDREGQRLYVLRAVHCYAWEAYDGGDNVILSRETRKWVRELVASVQLDRLADVRGLKDWLSTALFHAVVGQSRLPLTSVEAPLPAFSLGELAYFSSPGDETLNEPMRAPAQLIQRCLTAKLVGSWKAKLLETVLRSVPHDQLGPTTDLFFARWQTIGHSTAELPLLLRTLFDEVALSPYTSFVDRTLAFLDVLEERGCWSREAHVDFLSSLLRRLVRHLTAFDLQTFHHRGANYPDALLLEAALASYLRLGARQPDLFLATAGSDEKTSKRRRQRRRAARQAILLRCMYEGHRVPDHPVSPGENSRVLPPAFPRVPEEQILDPEKRSRRLYDGDPLLPRLGVFGRALLGEALQDLDQPAERQELGTALFLDRPLGIFQRPSEPDQTPLLSYETYSRTIAERRLRFMAERWCELAKPADWKRWQNALDQGRGIAVQMRPHPPRPGVASLADTMRVAPDFVLLRTTSSSSRAFLADLDFSAVQERFLLDDLAPGKPVLIVGGPAVGQPPGILRLYDAESRPRLELQFEPGTSAVEGSGGQWPEKGFRVLRVWQFEKGEERITELSGETSPLLVLPRAAPWRRGNG